MTAHLQEWDLHATRPLPHTQYLGYSRLASTLNVTMRWFLEGHKPITQVERSSTTSSLPRPPTSNKQHPSPCDTPSAVPFQTDRFHDRPFMLPNWTLRLCHGSSEDRWTSPKVSWSHKAPGWDEAGGKTSRDEASQLVSKPKVEDAHALESRRGKEEEQRVRLENIGQIWAGRAGSM